VSDRPIEPADPTEGASDPRVATPYAPWVRIVTLVVLAVFLLSIVVGALLV
jgi:hypothetical protein